MAIVAATNAVMAPIQAISVVAQGDAASSTGLSRTRRYTPDVTMVAAWMSADTGVGPAIASGSHTNSGICADFPVAATRKTTTSAVAVTPTIGTLWAALVMSR